MPTILHLNPHREYFAKVDAVAAAARELRRVRAEAFPKMKSGLRALYRTALNQQVAAKIDNGEPVTAPGVPKHYPDPKQLVTEDCIKPKT